MIKKNLIACSGLLIMMLSAKLFMYSTPVTSLNSFSQRVILPFHIQKEEQTQASPKLKIPTLAFSNEHLPQGKRIAIKMHKYLSAHSYKRIQTTKLHRKAAEWFPVIVPILKAYCITEDFKYMPLVESGLA